jgi:hypothetical protein
MALDTAAISPAKHFPYLGVGSWDYLPRSADQAPLAPMIANIHFRAVKRCHFI